MSSSSFHYKGHFYNKQGRRGLECAHCGATWRTARGLKPCRGIPNVFAEMEDQYLRDY